MNKKCPLLIFLILVILPGCLKGYDFTQTSPEYTQHPFPSSVVLQTKTLIFATTPAFTLTPKSSATIQPPTPTAPITTLTALPLKEMTTKCVSVEPDLPVGFLSTGNIIFSDERDDAQKRHSLLILHAEDLSFTDLKDTPTLFWENAVSNDNQFLAYRHIEFDDNNLPNENGELLVMDLEGNIISSMQWFEDWYSIIGWLDDEHLFISHFDTSWNGVYIVNPFTKDVEKYAPSLPNFYIDPYHTRIELLDFWQIVVDPTLSKVAYVRQETDGSNTLTLFNTAQGKELWQLKKKVDFALDRPVLSSSGNEFAVIVQDSPDDNYERFELYITDWTGHEEKWIDLVGNSKIGGGAAWGFFGGVKWSPDDRFIAIGGNPLIILDRTTHQIWNTCIDGGYWEVDRENSPISWSPDSKQLIITYLNKPSIVIDIENKVAVEINSNGIGIHPLGWLKGK